MNLTITGMGYVGLVTAACLAEVGHHVTCFDINETKIKQLQSGRLPIYEPGLEQLVLKNIAAGRLIFTDKAEKAYEDAECIFITVGTPEGGKGTVDLSHLYEALELMAMSLKKTTTIAIKSTVPVGTNADVQKWFDEKGVTVKVVSNPEFLREGSGIHDTFHADRIVVGTEDEEARASLSEIFKPFPSPIVFTDWNSAEMIKYAANAFLATKISFMNEMARLCELSGADVDEVATGIGLDQRIGGTFLKAGIGYGGSCFPKDTKALAQFGNQHGLPLKIVQATMEVNDAQHDWFLQKALDVYGDVAGLELAVLGLSFKPNTDDIREAPSLKIIEKLVKLGARVTVYDPMSVANVCEVLGDTANYANSIEEAVYGKKGAFLVTEWEQIVNFGLENYASLLDCPILFDGRNCFSLKEAEKAGINYYSVGRRVVL